MDITISTEELMQIQQSQNAKAIRIDKLEAQVADMKNDCDYWKSRALKAEAMLKLEHQGEENAGKESGKFIVLSVELLKSVLSKIHNLNILAVISLVIQKTLHHDATAEDKCVISDLVPLPHLPTISLTADGDIQVDGDWNDIHDNNNVNT